MTAVAPSPQKINARMLASDKANLDGFAAAHAKVAAQRDKPDFQNPASQAQLDRIDSDLTRQESELKDEIAIRQQLDDAYKAKDTDAQAAAKQALADFREAHKDDYNKAGSIAVCMPCVRKALGEVKHGFTSPEQVSNFITGSFEGGHPDYCTVADDPNDTGGGLSYGKHQAAEKPGSLSKMLKRYAQDPTADPVKKAAIAHRLTQFTTVTITDDKGKKHSHEEYSGTPAERAQFRQELKNACSDPAMQRCQDGYFHDEYMVPAMNAAQADCVSSPLAQSMYYDNNVQGGLDTCRKKAKQKFGNGAVRCKPCDPNGPSEAEFLQALSDARRAYVTAPWQSAATKSTTYREDFFDAQLKAGNLDLSQDFSVMGNPVKGLGAAPPASAPAPVPAPVAAPPLAASPTAPEACWDPIAPASPATPWGGYPASGF